MGASNSIQTKARPSPAQPSTACNITCWVILTSPTPHGCEQTLDGIADCFLVHTTSAGSSSSSLYHLPTSYRKYMRSIMYPLNPRQDEVSSWSNSGFRLLVIYLVIVAVGAVFNLSIVHDSVTGQAVSSSVELDFASGRICIFQTESTTTISLRLNDSVARQSLSY